MWELRHAETGRGLSRQGLENLGIYQQGPHVFGPHYLCVQTGKENISYPCVQVHTCNPRAWKEDCKASLGYRVKNPISTKAVNEKQKGRATTKGLAQWQEIKHSCPCGAVRRTLLMHTTFSVEPSMWDVLLGSSLVPQVICSSRGYCSSLCP